MSEAPVASKAQFWGGRFDGDWRAVSPVERESKRTTMNVAKFPMDPDELADTKIDFLTEIYLLKYSPTRKQWYFIYNGYEGESGRDSFQEPLD